MLRLNGDKYKSTIHSPFGDIGIYYEAPRLTGRKVRIRPFIYQENEKFPLNFFSDRAAMLASRWIVNVMGILPERFIVYLGKHADKFLYNANDYPELRSNNRCVQVVVEKKLENNLGFEPIGIIHTYDWNRSSGIIFWSEYFDPECKKELRITIEARALLLDYLVKVLNIRRVIANFCEFYGYPRQGLEPVGFEHTRTIPKLKRVSDSFYDVQEVVFIKEKGLKAVKSALKKINS